MLNVRFRVNDNHGIYRENYEYLANTNNKKHPEITYVTWHINGQLHKLTYNTEDVESYFLNGLWIEMV